MDWYDDILEGVGDIFSNTGSDIIDGISDFFLKDDGSGGSSLDIETLLPLLLAATGTSEGWFDAEQPKIGYQGKVPEYKAMQRQVPTQYGYPDRMPGEYGQQYFTDTRYIDKNADDYATQLANAATATNDQAGQIAQSNRDQSAHIEPLIDRMQQGYTQYAKPTYAPQEEVQHFTRGGIAGIPRQRPPMPQGVGRYMRGPGDGMSDSIPAMIGGQQPAELGDGEFVVPADAVSHLGNGSSNAGASQLQEMIERVRKARTGQQQQGQQINPNKFMPR